MRYCIYPTLAVFWCFTFVQSTAAQTYLQYRCEDGAQLSVAFVEKTNAAYLQLDGKSLILPQRLSGSGARYAKSGVKFWIKGNEAQTQAPKEEVDAVPDRMIPPRDVTVSPRT